MKTRRAWPSCRLGLSFLLVLFICLPTTSVAGSRAAGTAAQQEASILLTGAVILDGLGNPRFGGDLLIVGDRIAEVGEADSIDAPADAESVELDGLMLAPGFIYIHNHSTRGIIDEPEAAPLLSQGLTTIVVGADGSSPLPIADYLAEVDAVRPAVNVATLAGHGAARRLVMGDDFRREATAAEVEQMAALIEQAMRDGAFGLSTGLEYDPGFYSNTEELIALAEVTAGFGGFYMSHMRDEEETVMDAIDEAIEIGVSGGLPVQISHIKMGNASVWDRSAEALEKIQTARERGLDITADWYPYTAWASSLAIVVQSRRFSDPEAVAEGLAALGGANRLQITGYRPDPSIQGLRLDEIARRKGETAVDMYIEMMANGGARVIGHTMKVEDVNRFAASPLVMVCSDGGIGSAHPRGAGTFPRVLGYYVRDESVLSLELAIQKMTSMPAHRLGLESRGRIEPGAIADLTAFDPATVADNSTFEQPHLLSTGIEKVWVAGRLAWNGNPTDERAGQVLRRR